MILLAVKTFLKGVPLNVWLTLAAVVLLVVGAGAAYRWSFNRGADYQRAACVAQRAAEVAEAVERAEKAEQDSAEARAELHAYLSRELPKIEERSNDVIERVRTVYKDRPVPVGCERPADVRGLLQDRIDQANAAARR